MIKVIASWHYGGLVGDANMWQCKSREELIGCLAEILYNYDSPDRLTDIEIAWPERIDKIPKGGSNATQKR